MIFSESIVVLVGNFFSVMHVYFGFSPGQLGSLVIPHPYLSISLLNLVLQL